MNPENKISDSFDTYCEAAKAGRAHRERRTNANTMIMRPSMLWALWLRGTRSSEAKLIP